MVIGTGTLINVFAILLGAALGRIFGARLKAKTNELVTDVLGAVTLIGAASALASLWDEAFIDSMADGLPILVILLALVFGGLIGAALDIENGLATFGERLRQMVHRSRPQANANGSKALFVEGFVTASLIFVIGPLAILGSISDGMSTGIDQLLLKSMLDLFAAAAFAAVLGWGVAFSAIPVGIYQGAWTAVGFLLGSILLDYQVAAMTATGGVLLLGIGLKLLKIRDIAIGNLLPSLALAPIFALLASKI